MKQRTRVGDVDDDLARVTAEALAMLKQLRRLMTKNNPSGDFRRKFH